MFSRYFKCILAVVIMLLSTCVLAQAIPLKPTGYVNDYAHMLTAGETEKLSRFLRALEKGSGAQVVLATFNSLQGQPLEDFSIKLADQWKIGHKNKDNGVILLVIKNDHRVRIEVGYGLEGVLTDAVSGMIIRDNIIPAFKAGKYYQGIVAGLIRIGETIKPMAAKMPQTSTSNMSQKPRDYSPVTNIFIFVIPLLIILYLAISVIGNTILSCKHFFSPSKVTHSNRWFGPHAFFRVTLLELLLFWFFFSSSSGGGSGESGGFSAGGGSFGGGGASGSW